MRLCLLALSLAGCTGIPFLSPDMRTVADRAREVEPKCKEFKEDTAAPFLTQSSIDSVEPDYSYVKSGSNDHEARLRGARIHIKPLAGLSREAIGRILECHQSYVTLGATPPRADDPYVLDGTWLDISVDSEADGFAVEVRADSFDAARRILGRARRFAGGQAHE
jgi:hypothetical protein